jgi:hypothetical protein
MQATWKFFGFAAKPDHDPFADMPQKVRVGKKR